MVIFYTKFYTFKIEINKPKASQPASIDKNLISKPDQSARYVTTAKVLVTQSCLTLFHSIDCSPPGSSVHGIFQARILEWVAIPFSRGSS